MNVQAFEVRRHMLHTARHLMKVDIWAKFIQNPSINGIVMAEKGIFVTGMKTYSATAIYCLLWRKSLKNLWNLNDVFTSGESFSCEVTHTFGSIPKWGGGTRGLSLRPMIPPNMGPWEVWVGDCWGPPGPCCCWCCCCCRRIYNIYCACVRGSTCKELRSWFCTYIGNQRNNMDEQPQHQTNANSTNKSWPALQSIGHNKLWVVTKSDKCSGHPFYQYVLV